MQGSVEVGDRGLIRAPGAFSCLGLGAKKTYSWTEPGLSFAGGVQRKDSGVEELRVLSRE